ncbi:TetR/AcrR family transcriptional regulator [Polaribacter sp.]|uniref:TetR/AcrR family transcriptional regulator n=1 Tax=Polaribacter sp. TaxID=1920175 RepID=UPI0025D02DE0|nr:TetR/AcrR family transcriptional regulator [Polaribacter sp.]
MKDKILEKAQELFLNLGFKSVTMDEIANSLGISKKTLYKEYSNKTNLVGSVVNFMFDTVCVSIDEVSKQKMNPIDELFHIKRIVMEHLKDEKSSPLYQLQKYYPKIYNSLKEKQFEVMQETFQDNLQRGVQAGIFRKDIDIDFISRMYFNGATGIKDQRLFPLQNYAMNTLMNLFLDYHLRAIITPLGLEQLKNQQQYN